MGQRALGLMSGTSADGVSLALVEVSGRSLRILAHDTRPYPAALQRRILSAGSAGAAELSRLNFDLGRVFAAAARTFLKTCRQDPSRLAAVGSHGQTVIHLPREAAPSTLQIGEPSFLAEALGAPVVSDFRPRDMAAGGQGAPIVPFLDGFLYGGKPPRVLQNIGGIANLSVVGRGAPMIAFDTGPGNCLIDAAVRAATGGRRSFDQDGRLAARGRVDEAKVVRLLALPYFSRKPPKSLDRSEFGEAFLKKHFGRELKKAPNDAIATLTAFTAASIAAAIRRFVEPRVRPSEVVVSGGGALNPSLMLELAFRSPVKVRSIADDGVPSLAKEPAAIALMALFAVEGKTNHQPQATGARGARVLGKITPSSGR